MSGSTFLRKYQSCRISASFFGYRLIFKFKLIALALHYLTPSSLPPPLSAVIDVPHFHPTTWIYGSLLKPLPVRRPLCEGKTSLPSVDQPISHLGVLERKEKKKPSKSPPLIRGEVLRIRTERCSSVVGAENEWNGNRWLTGGFEDYGFKGRPSESSIIWVVVRVGVSLLQTAEHTKNTVKTMRNDKLKDPIFVFFWFVYLQLSRINQKELAANPGKRCLRDRRGLQTSGVSLKIQPFNPRPRFPPPLPSPLLWLKEMMNK